MLISGVGTHLHRNSIVPPLRGAAATSSNDGISMPSTAVAILLRPSNARGSCTSTFISSRWPPSTSAQPLTANARPPAIPRALAVREADPATGAIVGGNVKPGAGPNAFAVFALGESMPFDPASSQSRGGALDDAVRGSTSVAMTTRRRSYRRRRRPLQRTPSGNGQRVPPVVDQNNFTLDPAFIARAPLQRSALRRREPGSVNSEMLDYALSPGAMAASTNRESCAVPHARATSVRLVDHTRGGRGGAPGGSLRSLPPALHSAFHPNTQPCAWRLPAP